jgi:hypothetical protein
MEPQWTRQIQSSTICNFFYAFFVIYAVLFVASIVATLGIFGLSKKLGAAGVALGIQGLIMTGLGGTMMLFYYLICDRALLAKAAVEMKETFANMPARH